MSEKEKQIDALAKTVIYRAVNGRRCLRSGHCKHCGAHKAVTNPQYEKCDCYRMAAIVFDAGYRKQRESEWEKFDVPLMVRCSKCGVSILEIHRQTFVYCPYCGAKMKGGASDA